MQATFETSEIYAEQLLGKFSELLTAVGVGKKQWEVRFAPRGVISGSCEMLEGQCETTGNSLTSIDDCYTKDPKFKELIDGDLAGQHVSADNPALTIKFSLDVPEKLTKGGGADRMAPPFREFFNGDLKEHCTIASGLADKGPARAAVSQILGGSVGTPAHIIIPDSDLAGGITPMADQGGREAGATIATCPAEPCTRCACEHGLS